MSYKRPVTKIPDKPHQLETSFGVHGMLNCKNDEGWLVPHLTELHEDGNFALHQFQGAIKSSLEMNLKDFKDEVAKAKRAEPIAKGKRAMNTFLKKHIEKAKSDVLAIENKILRLTEPFAQSDPVKTLTQFLQFQEIRANLKTLEPKLRRQAVAGNLTRIQACLTNPDEMDVIIAPAALTDIRREYAFSEDKTLIDEERDQKEIYKVVRRRAAKINATAQKMLIDEKLDDPTSPQEHFEVFPPETDYEKHLAEKRIQAHNSKEDMTQRKRKYEDEHPGISL